MSFGSVGFIAVASVAFYVYYFMLGGKERMHKRAGLKEGEKSTVVYHVNYIPESSTGKDLALGLIGMERRGMRMTLMFSDEGYLVLGNQENKSQPRRYLPHQVSFKESSEKMKGRMYGPGGLEKFEAIILVTPDAGEEHLAILRSGAQAIRDFCAAGREEQAAYAAQR